MGSDDGELGTTGEESRAHENLRDVGEGWKRLPKRFEGDFALNPAVLRIPTTEVPVFTEGQNELIPV